MIPKSGTIYVYPKDKQGRTYTIPVEETPDDLSFLINEPKNGSVQNDNKSAHEEESIKKNSAHEELKSIAFTPIPEKPKPTNPFDFMPPGMGRGPMPFGMPNFPIPKPGSQPTYGGSPRMMPNIPGTKRGPNNSIRPGIPTYGNAYNQNRVNPNSNPNSYQPKPLQPSGQNRYLNQKQVNPGQNYYQNRPNRPSQYGNKINSINSSKPIDPVSSSGVNTNIKANVPVNPTFKVVPNVPNVNLEVKPQTPVVVPNPNNKIATPIDSKEAIKENRSNPEDGLKVYKIDQNPKSNNDNKEPKNEGGNGTSWQKTLGIALIAVSIGGMIGPLTPQARLETAYYGAKAKKAVSDVIKPTIALPPSVPITINPLIGPDGKIIEPINRDFSLIIPKIGVNSPVYEKVNPADPVEYDKMLHNAVAHASTSFLPNENGTVYLFSHSTNYQWFVKDLNAIFYMVKELVPGDSIVIYYKKVRYTYEVKEKRVVKPTQVSFLAPQDERKTLILQTCWPPGSVTERLLVFADLIEEYEEKI